MGTMMETAVPMMGAPAMQEVGGFGAQALPAMSAMPAMQMAAPAASAMPMMGAPVMQGFGGFGTQALPAMGGGGFGTQALPGILRKDGGRTQTTHDNPIFVCHSSDENLYLNNTSSGKLFIGLSPFFCHAVTLQCAM